MQDTAKITEIDLLVPIKKEKFFVLFISLAYKHVTISYLGYILVPAVLGFM